MTPFVPFVCLLVATGVMRLAELAVSHRRAAKRAGDVVGEGGLFLAMAGVHVGLVVLPILEVVVLDRRFDVGFALAVGTAFGCVTAVRAWTLGHIGRAWNVRILPPERVATTGPYRWIRHPNYLVVILEIALLPLLHGAWLTSATLTVANAGVLVRRIRNEEAELSRNPIWRAHFEHKARLLPGVW